MKKKILSVIMILLLEIALLSCSESSKTTEPDILAPTVNIEYPADSSEFVVGTLVLIKANATDNESISNVEFLIDGVIVVSVTKPPYEYSLNTNGIIGSHTILARAYDSSDNISSSTVVHIRVNEVNKPPVISSMTASPSVIFLGNTSAVECIAGNADGDALTYTWIKTAGTITGAGPSVTWTAPGTAGSYLIKCEVSDGKEKDTDSLFINVTDNNPPAINTVSIDSLSIYPNNSTQIICSAADADGDALNYIWDATIGTLTGSGASVVWTAPDSSGTCNIDCTVSDGTDSVYVRRSIYVSDGTITAVMVFVQGGSFDMGDHFNIDDTNELPVHRVTVSDFNIGKYEVTQSEWLLYMQAENFGYGTGDFYPAYKVSLYETISYCNRRSIAEKLTPCYSINNMTNPDDWGSVPTTSNAAWDAVTCNWSANGYRLPTEAEWEYAARGGTNSDDNYLYSGSDIVYYVGWYIGNNEPYGAKPAGSKTPNQLGIYDMTGNVNEWCWDWYSSSYYATCNELGTVVDPRGPNTGSSHVFRGGFWSVHEYNCRISFRDYYTSYIKNYSFGLRLVRNP